MTAWAEESQRLLRLAQRDLGTFRILAAHPQADLAAAAFHAQQAAEKALKSVLVLHGRDYPRTHDLVELAALVADAGISIPAVQADMQRLSPYAVAFRYDDQATALITMPQAKLIAETMVQWASSLQSK
jgi:HEPN domain-containing protein